MRRPAGISASGVVVELATAFLLDRGRAMLAGDQKKSRGTTFSGPGESTGTDDGGPASLVERKPRVGRRCFRMAGSAAAGCGVGPGSPRARKPRTGGELGGARVGGAGVLGGDVGAGPGSEGDRKPLTGGEFGEGPEAAGGLDTSFGGRKPGKGRSGGGVEMRASRLNSRTRVRAPLKTLSASLVFSNSSGSLFTTLGSAHHVPASQSALPGFPPSERCATAIRAFRSFAQFPPSERYPIPLRSRACAHAAAEDAAAAAKLTARPRRPRSRRSRPYPAASGSRPSHFEDPPANPWFSFSQRSGSAVDSSDRCS